ncbi:MAG: release factor glutamine methyltransferase [Actinomycetota bacterium]|nr:release factor glutamine methyltransferase [Actinomycetota bacterium]
MTQPVPDLVRQATSTLAGAGVPSPEHDAWALLEHATGRTRSGLLARGVADPGDYAAYVERRAGREPLQHITGRAYFRHLTLAVGPGVFVPRPETELVAEAAIAAAREVSDREAVVVDLGTGSGALALAVRDEVPGARVLAVESDPAAYAWAQRNCAGTDVELRRGDMADAFTDLDGSVDVVVSNPPYIPVGAHIRDVEVSDHDPAPALWSGADGLDAMRVVERVAARLLRPGGVVVAEHADLQGTAAPGVFHATGAWTDVADHRDLARRDRYLTGRRRAGDA